MKLLAIEYLFIQFNPPLFSVHVFQEIIVLCVFLRGNRTDWMAPGS